MDVVGEFVAFPFGVFDEVVFSCFGLFSGAGDGDVVGEGFGWWYFGSVDNYIEGFPVFVE